MNVDDAIRLRRSVRRYSDRPVPDGVVDECLRLALLAPTGGMAQAWSFIVVRDTEVRTQLAELVIDGGAEYFATVRPPEEGATAREHARWAAYYAEKTLGSYVDVPVWIVATRVPRSIFPEDQANREREADLMSVAFAMENLFVAARARGIGTVPTVFHWYRDAEFRALLNIPDHIDVPIITPFGYPVEFPTSLPPALKSLRRPWHSLVFDDGWEKPHARAGSVDTPSKTPKAAEATKGERERTPKASKDDAASPSAPAKQAPPPAPAAPETVTAPAPRTTDAPKPTASSASTSPQTPKTSSRRDAPAPVTASTSTPSSDAPSAPVSAPASTTSATAVVEAPAPTKPDPEPATPLQTAASSTTVDASDAATTSAAPPPAPPRERSEKTKKATSPKKTQEKTASTSDDTDARTDDGPTPATATASDGTEPPRKTAPAKSAPQSSDTDTRHKDTTTTTAATPEASIQAPGKAPVEADKTDARAEGDAPTPAAPPQPAPATTGKDAGPARKTTSAKAAPASDETDTRAEGDAPPPTTAPEGSDADPTPDATDPSESASAPPEPADEVVPTSTDRASDDTDAALESTADTTTDHGTTTAGPRASEPLPASEVLAAARTELGLSRIEIAEIVGATPRLIDEWISGESEPGRHLSDQIEALRGVVTAIHDTMSTRAARVWLGIPSAELDYYTPLDVLRRGELYLLERTLRERPRDITLGMMLRPNRDESPDDEDTSRRNT